MKDQITFMIARDGLAAAIEYALRSLRAYRSSAQYRNSEKPKERHFAHLQLFRPHFVQSIIDIRQFLLSNNVSPRRK